MCQQKNQTRFGTVSTSPMILSTGTVSTSELWGRLWYPHSHWLACCPTSSLTEGKDHLWSKLLFNMSLSESDCINRVKPSLHAELCTVAWYNVRRLHVHSLTSCAWYATEWGGAEPVVYVVDPERDLIWPLNESTYPWFCPEHDEYAPFLPKISRCWKEMYTHLWGDNTKRDQTFTATDS